MGMVIADKLDKRHVRVFRRRVFEQIDGMLQIGIKFGLLPAGSEQDLAEGLTCRTVIMFMCVVYHSL